MSAAFIDAYKISVTFTAPAKVRTRSRYRWGQQRHLEPFPVLENVTLQVRAGEIAALLGPSGCGKSTLLRVLAGQLSADQSIIGGRRVRHVVPASAPGLVWLPQRAQLVGTATVAANVALGARAAGCTGRALRERVDQALHDVRLGRWSSARPAQLSGGMQQRVALARVLASRPQVMLLDEPLSSLDFALRRQVAGRLSQYAKENSAAVLLSTHTIEESVDLADRVLLLGGSPASIVHAFRVSSDTTPPEPTETVCRNRAELLATVYAALQSIDGAERR